MQNWQWKTNVKITVRDLDGKILEVKHIKNLIPTVGLGMVIDLLEGLIADGKIKIMAVGSNATAPALGQTQLVAETFRKAYTSMSEPTTISLKTITYIAPPEAVGLINEIGWFAGVGALVGTPNSGIMVSRILYNRNKTAIESIQVERTDLITEA